MRWLVLIIIFFILISGDPLSAAGALFLLR